MQAAAQIKQTTDLEVTLRDEYEARLEASTGEINGLVFRQLELLREIDDLKACLKNIRTRLLEVRAENNKLKQYDPQRMKRNLDASKKKLAGKQQQNEILQKKLADSTKANVKLLQRISKLSVMMRHLASAGDASQRR